MCKLMRAEGITLHKPNVCEANHAYKNFAEYNKTCKLREPREKQYTNIMFVRQSTRTKTLLNITKRVKLKGTDGKALHKSDVCEAKHAYKNTD